MITITSRIKNVSHVRVKIVLLALPLMVNAIHAYPPISSLKAFNVHFVRSGFASYANQKRYVPFAMKATGQLMMEANVYLIYQMDKRMIFPGGFILLSQ
jgi:hypothetical protein